MSQYRGITFIFFVFANLVLGRGFANADLSRTSSPILKSSGVELLPQTIEYEVSRDRIQIGNQKFTAADITLLGGESSLTFIWPSFLGASGILEFKKDEEVIFSYTIKKTITENTEQISDRHMLTEEEIAKVSSGSRVSFCFRNTMTDLKSLFCSRQFILNKNNHFLSAKINPTNRPLLIIVNSKKAAPKGEVVLDEKIKKFLDITLQDGTFFSFQIGYIPLDLDDIFVEDDLVSVDGHNLMPYSDDIMGDEESWTARFPHANPVLYFGEFGRLPVKQKFVFHKQLPGKRQRINMIKRAPLYFSLGRNGVTVGDEQFDYDLGNNGDLRIGDLLIPANSFRFELSKEAEKNIPKFLLVRWLPMLLNNGKIEIKNGDKILATGEYNTEGGPNSIFKQRLNGDLFQEIKNSSALSFCVSPSTPSGLTRFCSRPFKLSKINNEYVFESAKPMNPQMVIADNGRAPLKGTIPVMKERPFIFDALTRNGSHYQIEVQSFGENYQDIVFDRKKVLVRGQGPVPHSNIVEGDAQHWRLGFELEKPTIYFWDLNNAYVLKQKLKIARKLPTERQRAYRLVDARSSTYKEHFDMMVFPPKPRPAKMMLATHENSIEEIKNPPLEKGGSPIPSGKYNWEFNSADKDAENKRHLLLSDTTGKYTMYYDAYRGYPFEVFAKLGALKAVVSGGFLLMGQLSAASWFEQIGEWNQKHLSNQHWGLSATYQNYFAVSKVVDDDMLTVASLSLHYRFSGGIKDHDPGLGASFTTQFLGQSGQAANLMGLGLFWFGNFPKPLEYLFNKIDFFKFKKWLEAKVEYYPFTLTNPALLAQNFLISVDSKIFFREKYFLLIGGEFRYYDIGLPIGQFQEYRITTSALTLTGGLGFHF